MARARIATAPRDRTQTEQVVGTPWEFIQAVESYRGELYCDVACNSKNCKAPAYIADPRSFDPAIPLTNAEGKTRMGLDGLTCPWPTPRPAQWNWMNPPFNDIPAWIEAIHRNRTRTLVLVPASVGTVWYANLVQGQAAVDFLSPRITFEGSTTPYPKDLMLLAFDFGLLDMGLLNTQPKQWRWR